MSQGDAPRVLLVDDDAPVLSALKRCLRREPFEVETANSARDALRRLEAERFDLVVSDQKMPGIDGVEFLTRVRAHWPETHRILLSGWTAEIPAEDLEAAGLDCVLGKPWDDEELRGSIRSAIGLGP